MKPSYCLQCLVIGFPTFHWVSQETFLIEAGHQRNVAYTKLDGETIDYQLEGTWKGNHIWVGLFYFTVYCLIWYGDWLGDELPRF